MSDPVDRLNAALEGRYTIERELGEGGMATVYLADDLKHERKVALKVLKPELAAVVGAERFLAEIKTTASLQHPHILPLHDSGEADSFLFYVMPFVEGETLQDRINREKQLPVDEAVRIAAAVASALQTAHEKGIIHRDIKPANILLSRGEPLIADFGIALAVGAAGGSRLTETGLSVGTPYYMSPEQATGDQAVGPSTDTYALGAVLYEMLTGDPPYMGSTAQAVLGQIIAGKPVSATEQRASIPANVDAAVRCALERLPADRFTSAQEFSRALGDPGFRYGELATAGSGAAVGPWNRLTQAGWGLAAVAIGIAAWSLLRPAPPPPVTRVSVALPDEQTFHPSRGDLDLSDDGSLFVYRGVGEQGQPQLWLRRWDALDATPIRDTQGATYPDLSPDGLEVAVIMGNSVRVVPLQGGVSRTLVDVDGGLCCPTWSPDGAWIYYTEAVLGLRRVPAIGGEPENIAEMNTTDGDLFKILSDVLPGGASAVFAAPRAGGGTIVRTVDLGTGEVRDLTSGTHPRYAPSGHLLFISEDATLLAAAFDVESLELTGAAVPVAERLAMIPPSIGFYAVSETGKLVYRTGGAGGGVVAPVWVERDGTAREIEAGWTVLATPGLSGLALSPSGDRLAITTTAGSTAASDVWVKQLDTGPLSRLTFDEGSRRPSWSSDGQSMTFISTRGGFSEVWTKRADGSGSEDLVLSAGRSIVEGFYSPDGTWLIFRVGTTTSGDILGIQPATDTVPVPLVATGFGEHSPTLSPDGRWLAYVSNEGGRDEVYVRPFPEVDSGRWLVSTDGGAEPVWAHSGRELFYRNGADELVAVQLAAGESFAWDGRDILFSTAGYLRGSRGYSLYVVSPDDQRFVMLQIEEADGGNELILVENWAEALSGRAGN